MVVALILILLNLLFVFFYPKAKKKYDNDYLKEKDRFIRKKIYSLLFYTNISILVIYIVYLYLAVSVDFIDISNTLVCSFQLVTFALLASKYKEYNKKLKILDKKLFNNGDILFIIAVTVISLSEKLNYNGVHNYFFEVINIILLIIGLSLLFASLWKCRGYVVYSVKGSDYLEDIRFANKIQISKIVNYFVYIIAFILIVLINFIYVYFVYAILVVIMFYIIKNKIKKVGDQSSRLYQSVTIAKELPGVEYAFYFFKDVYFIRRLLIILIGFIISIITYYGLGEGEFIYVAFAIYNLLLYVILYDKNKVIRYTRSLNKELIDTKRYSINQNKKITYVDTVNILDAKLYKLVIIDNLIYESNIIFYDPELVLKEIEVRINKNNLQDYIFNEKILYQEDTVEEEEE